MPNLPPLISTFAVAFVAAVEVPPLPNLPPLTGDPRIVVVIDVVRIVMLISGLCIAALAARHAVILPSHYGAVGDPFTHGFRWRSAAMIAGLLYVCTAAYDRLGEPVTVQFVLGLIFVLFAGQSVHVAATLPRPALAHEHLLRAHRSDAA